MRWAERVFLISTDLPRLDTPIPQEGCNTQAFLWNIRWLEVPCFYRSTVTVDGISVGLISLKRQ
jgi:hypothetical protein